LAGIGKAKPESEQIVWDWKMKGNEGMNSSLRMQVLEGILLL